MVSDPWESITLRCKRNGCSNERKRGKAYCCAACAEAANPYESGLVDLDRGEP